MKNKNQNDQFNITPRQTICVFLNRISFLHISVMHNKYIIQVKESRADVCMFFFLLFLVELLLQLVGKSDATISFRALFCGRRPTGCICHHCFSCHHSPPAPHIPLHSLKDLSPPSPASCSSSSSFSTPPPPNSPFPCPFCDYYQLAPSYFSMIFS